MFILKKDISMNHTAEIEEEAILNDIASILTTFGKEVGILYLSCK